MATPEESLVRLKQIMSSLRGQIAAVNQEMPEARPVLLNLLTALLDEERKADLYKRIEPPDRPTPRSRGSRTRFPRKINLGLNSTANKHRCNRWTTASSP
jgi:hypothetical protein